VNWDERYRSGEYGGTDPDPVLRQAVGEISPGRALDLACGAGRHALFLGQRGWRVTAIDSSEAAIEILTARAAEANLEIDARTADLESGDFIIEENAWDLICDFFYLQRDLFPQNRAGVRLGGKFAAAIPMIDPRPGIRPMNPTFLTKPGELSAIFSGWEMLHQREGPRRESSRAVSELIVRRPAIY
jgi:SAM-dependent methyltransferase